MTACFIRSFVLHKNFLAKSKTSSTLFFSSFSPIYDKISGTNRNAQQYKYKKLNDEIQTQVRHVSMNGFRTVYESLSNSEDVKNVQNFLIKVHDVTGLPWWATVISAAVAMKIFVGLPCGIFQQNILSKVELAKLELNASVEDIKKKVVLQAKKQKWTEKEANAELRREIKNQWKKLIIKNNCHPLKALILSIIQFPFWLMMTMSVRNLAVDAAVMKMENPMSELQFLVGGPIWSPNLAMPDPTFILPTINSLTMLTITEINILHAALKTDNKNQSFFLKWLFPNFLRLLAVLFFCVSSVSPSAVSLFWATSSLFALVQNLLLLSPRIRKGLRIPKTPTDLYYPYSQMWTEFLGKWTKLLFRK